MSRRQVKDYPGEYFDIWRLAIQGKLALTFPSKGMATNKKVDLQRFRKRLAEEHPELANEFFQIDLLVTGDSNGGYLQGYIPDWKQQVRKQLIKSDLSTEAVAGIAQETIETQEQETRDSMGDTLKGLGFKSPS